MIDVVDFIVIGFVICMFDCVCLCVEVFVVCDGWIFVVGDCVDVEVFWGCCMWLVEVGDVVVYFGFVDVYNYYVFVGWMELFELLLVFFFMFDEIFDWVWEKVVILFEDVWIVGGVVVMILFFIFVNIVMWLCFDEVVCGWFVVFMEDFCYNCWVSIWVLEFVGIMVVSILIFGVMVFDFDDGMFMGVFLEVVGILVQEVYDCSGGFIVEQYVVVFCCGIELLNLFGIMVFQDVGVFVDIFVVFVGFDCVDELYVWVVFLFFINDEIFGFDFIGVFLFDWGEEFCILYYCFDFVKIFFDGVLFVWMVFFFDLYLVDFVYGVYFYGEMIMMFEEFMGWLCIVVECGFGVKVYCMGDGFVCFVFDVVECLCVDGFMMLVQIVYGQFFVESDIF